MRILLVDDETLALDRLRTLFADIEGVEVVGQAKEGTSALALIAELTPDLVILDVQMPGRNGLRIAADMPQEARPEIIFVTAHEHYAPDAFEIEAADYLLKPVRFDRLRHAVERARRRRALLAQAARSERLQEELDALRAGAGSSQTETEIWVPDRQGHRRVAITSITWIEAARDYVLLHTELRSHMLRITMAGLEEKLAGTPFVRVHRSAFVRPDMVAEVRRAGRSTVLILHDETQVQVGPSYAASVEETLGFRKPASVTQ
ncbi:MAG: DNA-binding response regulator [Sphingobium sp.]|jgi:DNA-binding LytR/AlgR family response regulator|nr:MAG: DNA-binding response regulator [Sphingobium sp.]